MGVGNTMYDNGKWALLSLAIQPLGSWKTGIVTIGNWHLCHEILAVQ